MPRYGIGHRQIRIVTVRPAAIQTVAAHPEGCALIHAPGGLRPDGTPLDATPLLPRL
jgi:hypothetical protein